MDIDFSDLDGPSKAPATKPGKFAPKSKFKLAAKPKREPNAPIPSSDSNPVTVPKVEPEDLKPPAPVATVYSNASIEQPSYTFPPAHDANVSVKVDSGATEMEVDTDQQQDEEDEVVREIYVYMHSSADADSKICLLQYPLRQRWRPYELEERCEKVRLKPETAEVEIEMSAPVDPQNFDPEAKAVMPKQVLSTAWKPPVATNYAVGVLVGNKLHLNLFHAVAQLRPSMQHLKQANKQSNTVLGASNEKKAPIEKKALNEKKEYTKDEEWVSLKYHGEASQMSRRCLQNMVAAQEAPEVQLSMSPSDYLNSLCPTSVNPEGPSHSALLKLPLEDRFKIKLRKGLPVRFNVFKHIAPDSSIEDMFKVLGTHALLVQGFWVAKSKLIYGEDGGNNVLFRNFVLLQFSKNPIIHKSQLPKPTSQTLVDILQTFGRRRELFGDWEFKDPTDDLFMREYPNIAEEQKKIWDRVEPQIMDCLFGRGSKPGIGTRYQVLSHHPIDVETKPTSVPPSREDENREALPKALQKLFQAHKVCSLNQIRQRLRDMAVSENRKGTREARAAADASQEELLKTLNQVAVNINGVFVFKSSLDYPQYDDFRSVVINLLIAEGPNGRLKKGSIEAAASVQLKRVPNAIEYRKVLEELCISQNSAWVLKSGDGSPT